MAHVAQRLIPSFFVLLFPTWNADVLASQFGLSRVMSTEVGGVRESPQAAWGLFPHQQRCQPTQTNAFSWGYFTSASQELSSSFS